MTVILPFEVSCVCCGRTSHHGALGSSNFIGAYDLDGRPPEYYRSTMSNWIQQCPGCGYSARDISTASGNIEIVSDPSFRTLLEETRYPPLARRFLAYALLLQRDDPVSAGFARLHAAWVCDDENEEDWVFADFRKALDQGVDSQQAAALAESRRVARPRLTRRDWSDRATEIRNEAAKSWLACKPFEDSGAGLKAGRALVDVLRRVGDFAAADRECRELLSFRSARGLQGHVLRFQQRLIAERSVECHTVDEVPQPKEQSIIGWVVEVLRRRWPWPPE